MLLLKGLDFWETRYATNNSQFYNPELGKIDLSLIKKKAKGTMLYFDVAYWLNLPLSSVEQMGRDEFLMAQYRMVHIKKQWRDLLMIGVNQGVNASFKGDDDNSK